MAHHIFHRGAIEAAAAAGGGGTESPDFAGLTRIEWTVENMGTSYSADDPVGTWTSITADSTDLTASGTLRPLYKTDRGVTNGIGVLYDGSNDLMSTATGLGLDMSGGCHVFACLERTVYGSTEGFFHMRKAAGAGWNAPVGMYYSAASTVKWDVNRDIGADAWDSTHAVWDTNDPAIFSARYQAGTVGSDDPLYVNGAAVPTNPTETDDVRPPQTAIDSIWMGSGWTAAWDGAVYAFVIYYGADMTNAQVESVHASLNSRFGVY